MASVVLAGVASGCSPAAPASMPSDGAPPDVVLVTYLDALVRGDCAAARSLSTPTFAKNGPWCLVPHVTAFSSPGLGYLNQPEAGYSTQITTAWGDDSLRDGEHTWFYTLRRDADGPWRVADAGSGP